MQIFVRCWKPVDLDRRNGTQKKSMLRTKQNKKNAENLRYLRLWKANFTIPSTVISLAGKQIQLRKRRIVIVAHYMLIIEKVNDYHPHLWTYPMHIILCSSQRYSTIVRRQLKLNLTSRQQKRLFCLFLFALLSDLGTGIITQTVPITRGKKVENYICMPARKLIIKEQ